MGLAQIDFELRVLGHDNPCDFPLRHTAVADDQFLRGLGIDLDNLQTKLAPELPDLTANNREDRGTISITQKGSLDGQDFRIMKSDQSADDLAGLMRIVLGEDRRVTAFTP